MLDGRIDTQGTVKELRVAGLLQEIEESAKQTAKKEEPVAATEATTDAVGETSGDIAEAKKKPSKLIQDEHREEGGVKWSVYKTYLRAS